MSYNIRCDKGVSRKRRRWSERLPIMAEAIQVPDIVGFQEVLPHQLADLQLVMQGFSHIGAGRVDGAGAGEHVPIFYRDKHWQLADSGHFWLSDTPELAGSTTWGNRIPRMCSWVRIIDRRSNQGLYVYNTHFDHISWRSRFLSAGTLLVRMLERSFPADPVILTGDLNCRPGSKPLRRLLGDHGVLQDSYVACQQNPKHCSTYNAWRVSMRGRRKIDHILVSSELQVLSSEIVCIHDNGVVASDHHALRTTIKWR